MLLEWLNMQIAQGNEQMLAEEFCTAQRKSQYIIENIHEYIFGYHRKLEEIRNTIEKEGDEKLTAD